MEKRGLEKYGLPAFILLVLVLSFFIVKSFINLLLLAIIIVYFFYPLYLRLNKRIESKAVCSLIFTILILLLIVIPVVYVVGSAVEQLIAFYKNGGVQLIIDFGKNMENPAIEEYVLKGAQEITSSLISYASKFIVSIPNKIFNFLMFTLTLFYLFIDWEKIVKKVKELIPFKKQVVDDMKDNLNKIIYGIFFIALIEGLVVLIGFSILHLPLAFFWAILIALSAILPFFGAAIIWAPYALIELIFYHDPFIAAGITFFGGLASFIDTFIRPKFIANKSKMHPIIVLLGLVGGIKLFGIAGIIIGPIILSMFIVLIENYKMEKWS